MNETMNETDRRMVVEAAERLVEARIAQGLPPTVEDPEVLRQLAAIFQSAQDQQDQEEHSRKEVERARQRRYSLKPEVKERQAVWERQSSPRAVRKQELWDLQQGLCAACHLPLTSVSKSHLDHDHSHCPEGKWCRSCTRGLVHPHCNFILGAVNEDPSVLRSAADYLDSWKVHRAD